MIIYLIIILAIIFVLSKQLPSGKVTKSSEGTIYPYKKVTYLLSLAEKNFYDVLSLAIKNSNYYICPKVRLADIIFVGKVEKRQSHFNKIQSKHIDFLLCDKDTLTPLVAIELDDSSHQKDSRIQRDIFVDNALHAAGLKFIRFKVKQAYTVNEIKDLLDIKVPI